MLCARGDHGARVEKCFARVGITGRAWRNALRAWGSRRASRAHDLLLQDAVSMGVLVVVQEAMDIALHIASDEGWELAQTYRDAFMVRPPRYPSTCTRIVFVLPLTPIGAPNTITTRSPGEAIPQDIKSPVHQSTS